ncbi:MAG: hypothetical protein V1778_03965 [bacterium]
MTHAERNDWIFRGSLIRRRRLGVEQREILITTLLFWDVILLTIAARLVPSPVVFS